jgi:hypothetical protein
LRVVGTVLALVLLAVIAASAVVIAKDQHDAAADQHRQTVLALEAECYTRATAAATLGDAPAGGDINGGTGSISTQAEDFQRIAAELFQKCAASDPLP